MTQEAQETMEEECPTADEANIPTLAQALQAVFELQWEADSAVNAVAVCAVLRADLAPIDDCGLTIDTDAFDLMATFSDGSRALVGSQAFHPLS
jgi:hypothetical protein